MSARLATPLVVLSRVLPTVASAQDSLTVEQRLGRIETQLAAAIATLDLDWLLEVGALSALDEPVHREWPPVRGEGPGATRR